MPRGARKAPDREPDPLDDYSTWDIRIAKVIYYGFILATAIFVLGVWALILNWVIRTGKWDFFVDLDLGYQIAIIGGAVTGHLFLLVLEFRQYSYFGDKFHPLCLSALHQEVNSIYSYYFIFLN